MPFTFRTVERTEFDCRCYDCEYTWTFDVTEAISHIVDVASLLPATCLMCRSTSWNKLTSYYSKCPKCYWVYRHELPFAEMDRVCPQCEAVLVEATEEDWETV